MTGIPPLALSRAGSRVKLPKPLSKGEETFALHMKARGLSPVREHEFCPGRKWRFDFCFVGQKLAIEIDGGSRSRGRHTRGNGFKDDCLKLNAAVILGFRVLRYTTEMVLSGEAELQVAQLMGAV